MQSLRSRLPPLSSLLAFEAAARHLSFTLAASELGVSQAAVSRQVRALEDHLGTPLFRRLHRAVRLTEAGERLHTTLAMSLRHIAEMTDALRRARGAAAVTVCTTVAFAAFWLMPRIGKFRQACPGIEIKLVATEHFIDLTAEQIDMGVRYGNGEWTDVVSHRLFDDEIFPICSPSYLAGRPALQGAADLVGETLLHQEVPDLSWLSWQTWLERSGVKLSPRKQGPTFNNYVLMIQAAQSGQGIALGWRHLVDHLIEAGTLVRPVATTLRSDYAFHLVAPRDAELSPEVSVFRDWFLAEAALHESTLMAASHAAAASDRLT
ncbi:MAG: transcriptional regulator GcvA [Kiloniellales bacterium]